MSENLLEKSSKITLEEFTDFLSRKNISNVCKNCGEPTLQINMKMLEDNKKAIRIIEGLVHPREEEVIFPFLSRTCANCFFIESYGALLVLKDIEKNREINNPHEELFLDEDTNNAGK
tara:strand:- start:5569 stop:5922 length:354 start_codon:yes stop_codon:yes gene_type:complete